MSWVPQETATARSVFLRLERDARNTDSAVNQLRESGHHLREAVAHQQRGVENAQAAVDKQWEFISAMGRELGYDESLRQRTPNNANPTAPGGWFIDPETAAAQGQRRVEWGVEATAEQHVPDAWEQDARGDSVTEPSESAAHTIPAGGEGDAASGRRSGDSWSSYQAGSNAEVWSKKGELGRNSGAEELSDAGQMLGRKSGGGDDSEPIFGQHAETEFDIMQGWAATLMEESQRGKPDQNDGGTDGADEVRTPEDEDRPHGEEGGGACPPEGYGRRDNSTDESIAKGKNASTEPRKRKPPSNDVDWLRNAVARRTAASKSASPAYIPHKAGPAVPRGSAGDSIVQESKRGGKGSGDGIR